MSLSAGVFPIDSFGGLVTSPKAGSVVKMDRKNSPKCMNVFSRFLGPLRKCLGYSKLNSASLSKDCNGVMGYTKDSSNVFLVGLWDSTLYKMDRGGSGWDGTWDTITQDTASSLSDAQASLDVFNKAGDGVVIIGTAAQDLPHYWLGSGNTVVIAGGTKAKRYKVWMNHVFAFDCVSFTEIDTCDDPWDVNELLIEDCEDTWDEQTISNVEASTDATTHKVGNRCAKIVIAAGFTTGIAATEELSALDISDYSYCTLWVKSSVNTNSGDIQLMLDEDADCASPSETLDIPSLTADTWTQVQLTFAGATADRDVIISIGLNVAVDNGAQTVYLDDIRAANLQYIKNSTDQEDTKDGDASVISDIEASHGTGLVCAKELSSSLDLSEDDTLVCWVKSSYDSSGDADSGLQILLDDTDDCSSATTKEALTIPKMSANTWTYHEINLANATNDTAINSVGLKVATDKGAQTVRIAMVRTTHPEPDQMSRSALGSYTDWTGTDSGSDNIHTKQDRGLTGEEILGGSLYVFKSHSIHRVTYQTGRPLLRIKEADGTIGTKSPQAICSATIPGEGPRLIFLGTDRQLYKFDGYTPTPVGDDIRIANGYSDVYLDNITTSTGVDNALSLCHAIVIPERHWYVLFCPQGATATACTHAIIYDYADKVFFPMDTQAFSASWYGDDGDSGGGTSIPFVAKTNYAYKWWDGNDFDGSDIACYWESCKLSPSKKGRPLEKVVDHAEVLIAAVASATVTFSYRMDWQSSYIDTGEITTTTAGVVIRDVAQTGNLYQVKFSDSSSNPSWEVYGVDILGKERSMGRNT